MPFLYLKVQSATFSQSIWTFTYLLFASRSNRLARTFWTSTCLLDASKSILLFCHEYFGLSLEFSSFQGPIHHFLATVLDLQQPFICSKVQSATFSQSIWTFSNLFSASASNPQNPRTSLLTQQASFTLPPVSGMPS